MISNISFKETETGIICGYCGWKIDKPSDSLNCRSKIQNYTEVDNQ